MSDINEDENSSSSIDWEKFKKEFVKLEADVQLVARPSVVHQKDS